MAILEQGFESATAVSVLPEHHQKRLRTTNSQERLNEEIRRLERVIRIFPNQASAERLFGALLMEQDEIWSTGRKYLDMEEYWTWKTKQSQNNIRPLRVLTSISPVVQVDLALH